MFVLVLQQCHRESEERWKRLSRQVTDILLPALARQQVGDIIVILNCGTLNSLPYLTHNLNGSILYYFFKCLKMLDECHLDPDQMSVRPNA